jgi:glycosyltransferase involved in cell wall biosynthesis
MSHIPKLRLFIDAHCFDKEHQGTRAFIKRLYSEFAKSSPHIELCFGAYDTVNLQNELKDIPHSRFIRYRFRRSSLRLLFEFPYIIYKYKIDIAHFQYISPIVKTCRVIVTTHDILFKDFRNDFPFLFRLSRNFLFRYSISRADIKTTVSRYSKQAISKHFNIPLEEILIISNGVSQVFFDEYDKNASKRFISAKFNISKYILYVSRIEPRKNHVSLLKAFLELKLYKEGFHLVLLGHSSILTPEFNKLYGGTEERIKKFIFMSSTVNEQCLFHFYKGAEVLVFPSKAEGFGLPPIEAGALRVPVICSNTTAMSDYTFFGEYHLNPEDNNALKSGLQTILSTPPSEQVLMQISKTISDKYQFHEPASTLLGAINKLYPRQGWNT